MVWKDLKLFDSKVILIKTDFLLDLNHLYRKDMSNKPIAYKRFGWTVSGQDYLDMAFEFLVLLLETFNIISLFIIFFLVFIHWTPLLNWSYIRSSYDVRRYHGLLVVVQFTSCVRRVYHYSFYYNLDTYLSSL